MEKLLVVDDDRSILRLVEKSMTSDELQVLTAGNAEDGLSMIRESSPDVMLLDIMLPDKSGLEIARAIKNADPRLPVIFITASNDSDLAIEAMKLGAYEILLKPLDVNQLHTLVERAIQTRRLMHSPVVLQETESVPQDGDAMVGRSPAMLEVYKQIGRVAEQDVTVLIRGESGTGKELVARAIYQHSHRAGQCYLAVNCAALSDTLLESELFGHEKGAFTGADRRHIGKFEQCNGGTIFLDEIGDMSALTQGKVLRLMQEQKFERVGGSDTITTNVRMVAATNRPLEEMIEENGFRLDLYHRLNTFEIHLPPLRERGNDVELLANHFLSILNRKMGKEIRGISDSAMKILRACSWPGNIRELQGVLRKSILMATGPVIVPEFLPRDIVSGEAAAFGQSASQNGVIDEIGIRQLVDEGLKLGTTSLYSESLERMENYLIKRVLQFHDGNQSRAAETLGITRGSLRNKIKSLGISIEKSVVAGIGND